MEAADEVEDFGGDFLLTALVVLEGELVEEFLGVVGGNLHGYGTGSMFGSIGVEQNRVYLQQQHLGQQGLQNLDARRLKDAVGIGVGERWFSG